MEIRNDLGDATGELGHFTGRLSLLFIPTSRLSGAQLDALHQHVGVVQGYGGNLPVAASEKRRILVEFLGIQIEWAKCARASCSYSPIQCLIIFPCQ